MKGLILTIILCITIGINIHSQRKPRPEKLTIIDFTVIGDRSVYLWYKSIFTYPYNLPNEYCGMWDRFFKVKNETRMRIILNKNDTVSGFFALHKFYNSIPKLNDVTKYYPNGNKIISSNIKGTESVIIINYFDKGCFFDLTALKDSTRNVIVDIKFTYPISSKKEIDFYLDKNLDYKFLYIRMDVPEIYKYNIKFNAPLSYKISRPHFGPIIGYYYPYPFSNSNNFISLDSWNRLYKSMNSAGRPGLPSAMPIPYYGNFYSHIFISNEPIDSEYDNADDNYPALIKFNLNKTIERWRP